MAEMKGIKLCGECINYDWKKHKCKIGCNDDSNAQAPFYGDCPLPDVVPKSDFEKQKLEIWRLQGEAEQLKRNLEQCENGYRQQMHLLQCKLTIAKYEVARAFRQRMNEKMGKHTHLLGKEYVQRIMREIEKEFTEESNEV